METSYRRALQLSQKLKDPGKEATSRMNLAGALHQQWDFWKAIEACELSRAYWQRERDWKKEVNALYLLGQIYTATGEYTLALDRYRMAERMIPTSDVGWLARIFNRYADVLQRMGEPEEARPYATQALVFSKKAKDLNEMGVSLVSLGLLDQELRDFQSARKNQAEALGIFRRLSDARGETTAYINLGLLSLAEKKTAEAFRFFQQGLSMSRPLKFPEGEAVALYGMAYAERERQNLDDARVFVEEAIELIESLRKEAERDDLKASFLQARLHSYELLIEILVRPSGSETAPADLALSFETSERLRARSLLESLAFSGRWDEVQDTADPEVLALYRQVNEEIDRRAEERRRLKAKDSPTGEVDRILRSLFDQSRNLEIRIQGADRRPASPNRQVPVTLAETQGLLDEDTVLLEYQLGRKRSFLWLVTPSYVKVFILPPREKIEAQALKVYRLVRESQAGPGITPALEAARELSNSILAPVAGYLGKKRLIIVADGALHYVPFAVFPDPAVKPQGNRRPSYLIANHEVVNLPSASVLRELRAAGSRRTPPPGLLAMVTNPDFVPGGFPPLMESVREAGAILDRVPRGEKTLELEGPRASRELVTSGQLSGYRIVHFTTHGVIDESIPELSGIVLSREGDKDGYLRVRDVQRLRLPASLVVLSACNTARGKVMRGEGLVGFTHSFMNAGTSTVVVSHWNVNEDSTPTFMRHFYRALLSQGHSPSAALRSAQLAMAQDSRWSSPYYWSGFTIHGEWRRESP